MVKKISILLISLFVLSCSQNDNTIFSNDHLIGEFSSKEGGQVEFVIKKDESGYYLQQLIENGTTWSPRENLTPMTEKELENNLGANWKDYTLAGLTSGTCSYFRGTESKLSSGITIGDQDKSKYFSRCFTDNNFFRVK
ncbi:hypothetical protein [Tenacibaculum sp. nBUS_03]|uniref:hypothetical protein n=1 Tax=Tenacibaculum sp. nBUS_03 TaxID=3395320 RepID=UPI003EC0F67F